MKKIGEILLDAGLLTSSQLASALALQEANPNMKIGEILVDKGIISLDTLLEYLDQQIEKQH